MWEAKLAASRRRFAWKLGGRMAAAEKGAKRKETSSRRRTETEGRRNKWEERKRGDCSRTGWWTAAPIWRSEAPATWGSFFSGRGNENRPAATTPTSLPHGWLPRAAEYCIGRLKGLLQRWERTAAEQRERGGGAVGGGGAGEWYEGIGWLGATGTKHRTKKRERTWARGLGCNAGWRHTRFQSQPTPSPPLAPPVPRLEPPPPSRLVAAYHTSVKRHSMPAMKSLYVLYVRSPTVLYVSMCTQMRGEQRLGVRTRQPTSSLSFSLFLFVYTVRPIRAYQRIIYSAGASLAAPTATRPDRPTDFRHGRPYIHLCFLPFFPSFFRPLFPRTALFPLFFSLFLFCSRRLFPLFFFDLCFFFLLLVSFGRSYFYFEHSSSSVA